MKAKMSLPWHLIILIVFYLSPILAVQTVSIGSALDSSKHNCVTYCISYPLGRDIGSVMKCAYPYVNDCYCATARASAAQVTSFVTACASSSCAAGDFSNDLSIIQSIYASYCMDAGFTQPGATDWYNPAAITTSAQPSKTATSGPRSTTSQLTTLTQTTTSSGNSAETQSQVTAHTASTLSIGPSGFPSPFPPPKSGPNKAAVGAGLGLGIPILLAVVVMGILLRMRRHRRPHTEVTHQPPGQSTTEWPQQQKPFPESAIIPQTPPAMSQSAELTGDGVRRELAGTEMHPFPVITPSPPVAMPGKHEMSGIGRMPEPPGQMGGPPRK